MTEQNEFANNGVAYVTEAAPLVGDACLGCAFLDDGCGCLSNVIDVYPCKALFRADTRDIIWKRKLCANE
ncbi:MAG: hypothetical protein ACXV8O_01265 [Methylobacter sp.]